MAKPFYKLRFALGEADINQMYLSKMLDRSTGYISARMTGKESWTIEDAYKILKILGEPVESLTEYFPPKEKEQKTIKMNRKIG